MMLVMKEMMNNYGVNIGGDANILVAMLEMMKLMLPMTMLVVVVGGMPHPV